MEHFAASVTEVANHLTTQNIWTGDYESYKTVAVPILECGGLPGEQICGWVEDSFLFFKCQEVCGFPEDTDLRANENLIKEVVKLSYEDLCEFCSGQVPPLNPIEYIKEKAQELLRSVSVNMTSVKIFLALAQFLHCVKKQQELDQNEHSIRLISRNLDDFGRREMSTIAAFLTSPEAVAVFGRQPESAMPNPSLGGITPQWLGEARRKLNQITADIDEAKLRAKRVRFWSAVNAGFSLFKISHSIWTWKAASSSDVKLHIMHGVSVGADVAVGAWSLNLAGVAHIQIGQLQALEAQLSGYVDRVGDAEYVLSLPAHA